MGKFVVSTTLESENKDRKVLYKIDHWNHLTSIVSNLLNLDEVMDAS